MTTDI